MKRDLGTRFGAWELAVLFRVCSGIPTLNMPPKRRALRVYNILGDMRHVLENCTGAYGMVMYTAALTTLTILRPHSWFLIGIRASILISHFPQWAST